MRRLMAVVVILAGCATLSSEKNYSEEEMMTAAAALTKVSAAAEANLLYGADPSTSSDATFLTQSVEHDPKLLSPFSAYHIKAMRQDGHAAILVCSQDGTVALLEDAGCTATMDLHRWRANPRTPCVFTIDLAQLCSTVR